ncbi:hypothetical protein E2C01_003608 [Portunus trituberculatus]|uniref:Uncharacterized protein n=1 Tax=Portunus trituberculatus TaxID=210409 RepID=A0A5B7CMK6_PORTR|nr:hypothetical protein [Portunus trituberculatus]
MKHSNIQHEQPHGNEALIGLVRVTDAAAFVPFHQHATLSTPAIGTLPQLSLTCPHVTGTSSHTITGFGLRVNLVRVLDTRVLRDGGAARTTSQPNRESQAWAKDLLTTTAAIVHMHYSVHPLLLSNDVPPPLNTTSCANGNLLYVFVGGAQLGRQVHRDICVRSSAMATSDINCKVCEFDYWEIIASAMQVSVQSRRGPSRTFILSLRYCEEGYW